MTFLVRFTDPKGNKFFAVNPFDHHALYGAREHAEQYQTRAKALNFISHQVWCNHAYWPSEREHARQREASLRGWKVSIVDESEEPLAVGG